MWYSLNHLGQYKTHHTNNSRDPELVSYFVNGELTLSWISVICRVVPSRDCAGTSFLRTFFFWFSWRTDYLCLIPPELSYTKSNTTNSPSFFCVTHNLFLVPTLNPESRSVEFILTWTILALSWRCLGYVLDYFHCTGKCRMYDQSVWVDSGSKFLS